MANASVHLGYYVYLHRRSTDGKVFYVGKGKGRRAWDFKARNNHWHRVFNKHGATVEIVESGMAEWWAFEMEEQLIACYWSLGLANHSTGGGHPSGWHHSIDSKKRISESNMGKQYSLETRKKMSESHLVRAPMSEETKLRMSKARAGTKKSAEVVEKTASKNRGRKNSEESIRRMCESWKKRRAWTPEEKAEISRRISEGTKRGIAKKRGQVDDSV
jgi:hypothetical protein